MDKLEFRLFLQALYVNKWIIIVALVLSALILLMIFSNIEERVSAECTVIEKGVSFSYIGNHPEARCILESGHVVVVRRGEAASYKVGQVITV